MAATNNEEDMARLKNLVFRTLDNNGVLGSLRAQLRANM